MVKLVCEWVDSNGGVAAFEKKSEEKAALLYNLIDESEFWRSKEELEDEFVKQAKEAGFIGLKGHRSVGGIRASIYNAVTLESVEALVSFMKDFEQRNG